MAASGCVSKAKYTALQASKSNLEAQLNKNKTECELEQDRLQAKALGLEGEIAAQDIRIAKLRDTMNMLRAAMDENNMYIKSLNSKLDDQSQLLAQQMVAKNKTLQAKELQLNEALGKVEAERSQLSALRAELNAQNDRILALERELNSKDSAAIALKSIIQKALAGFDALDISVEQRNGRVYLSLSEKLLFKSGSTAVDPVGRDALLKITGALAKITDLGIMVEGHTDNKPMAGDKIKDNWDLSVMRATSIVRILTDEGGLNPKMITASGRGETMPVASNESVDGRAKNRRTEIVLTPRMDKIMELLK